MLKTLGLGFVSNIIDSVSTKSFVLASGTGVSIKGFYDWFAEQAKYALFLVLLVLLIGAIIKRAWIFAVGVLVGLALIGIFILNPDALLSLSEWLSGLLNIGN